MDYEKVAETGEPFATISVNFAKESKLLPPGAFYVKDWSENAQIVPQLLQQGKLIPFNAPPVHSGFVVARAYTWRD